MKETMNMRGQLTVQLSDQAGRVVHRQSYKNHIVTTGRVLVGRLFSGQARPDGSDPAPITHMAVGSGSDAATDADIALAAQRGERKSISVGDLVAYEQEGVTRVRVPLQAVFDYADANDPDTPLQEAGIFNAEEDGVMYNRVVFEPVTKTDAFKLTLLWDIEF